MSTPAPPVSATGGDYFRNAGAQAIGRAVSLAASFAAFVLLARVLGSDVLGQYSFVLAFVATAGTIADSGTSAALTRGLVETRARGAETYLGSYLLLRLGLALAVGVAAVPIALSIRPDIRVPLLIGCALVPIVTLQFFDTIYQVFGRARYAAYSALTLGGARLLVAVVLLYVIGTGLAGYMAGYLLAQSVYLIVAVVLMLRLVRPRWPTDGDHLRATLRLAAPMGVAELFNAVYTRTDIVMLTYMRSATEVGQYAAANRLLDFAVIAAVVATTPLVPLLTQRLYADRVATRLLCKRICESVVVVCLPGPILAGVVAEPLMTWLYGPAFAPAAALLPVFSWLFLATVWFMVAAAINLATGHIRHGYWSSAATAALNIVLNLWLIPEHGAVGAAWATVLSIAFKVVVAQVYVGVGLGNVFDGSRWLRIAVCACVLAGVAELLTGRWPVAGSIAAILAYLAATAWFGLLPLDQLRNLRASATASR